MRKQIRNELISISPFDTMEREDISRCLAWIDSGLELCRVAKPATPPMHLVSYFVVVDDDHVLLVDHKNAQLWLPPGGHVEQGEHPRVTVERELEEELGFVASHPIQAPLFMTITTTVGLTAGHTDVSLWYVVRASRHQSIQFDEGEFRDARWFQFDEVPLERTDPHMKRFLAKLTNIEHTYALALGSTYQGSPLATICK
ncbi:NUDIX hydrolase [Undibacterium sp. JH2W]|uniref:NUDIX hydrolase n=1 Tax=Undibacterium sp. JH2W TaxID=3413037 RepID=UPI003BF41EED